MRGVFGYSLRYRAKAALNKGQRPYAIIQSCLNKTKKSEFMNTTSPVKAPRALPILLVLIAAPMILGGVQLIFLGGSFYYLLAGLVLVASARRLWRASPTGSLIYGGFLIATVAWALLESGTNLWALAPRILPFAGLGLWFLTPWLRRALYQGQPPKLLRSDISRGSAMVVVLVSVFVLYSGSGYDVNPLSARSGINTVNTQTDWPSYGNDAGGSRY